MMTNAYPTPATITIAMPKTLSGLLGLYDDIFVVAAYETILGRGPDPDGLQHHVAMLRLGHSKYHIIAALHNSPEGQVAHANLDGIVPAMRRYRRANRPFTGWFFRYTLRDYRNDGLQCRLRALENLVGAQLQNRPAVEIRLQR